MTWDRYFYDICKTVSSKSPCLSRKIGAILVKDHSILSTGYNGPPRGIPHCGTVRTLSDPSLPLPNAEILQSVIAKTCPRRLMGFTSGEGIEWCTAQHAEENAVSNAARNGISINRSTLYMNSVIPCQKCFGTLINAGINEIVVEHTTVYDVHTRLLLNNSSILIRNFQI